jgi:hypothetical protein
MPKMRGFKAEIWTDEKFVELPPLARLLFMGMWSYACDNGHLDDKPKQIKMRVLPTDDVDPAVLIEQMIELGMVERHDDMLTVTKLREHQRIDERYFAWCDRCSLEEIPERSKERYLSATTGTRERTRAHAGAQGNTRAPAMKEGRKEGEGEGESTPAGKPAKRATSLPADFRPTDKHLELAAELGVDLRREWPKFCDHHAAKGTTFKDWGRALNTWIRNSVDFGKVRPIHSGGPNPDAWMARRPK